MPGEHAGPIEIPDHVLVRQTVGDTLHEALDVDGTRDLLERLETGTVTVHFADTTEPSVLAHEILTARPYAFLDDEEFQNRRTNAVTLRRGLAVDLGAIGALDPEAIEQVHGEITPEPASADDLHDLLASLVVGATPRRNGARSSTSWRRAAVRRVLEHRGAALWCTTERVDDAQRAFAEEEDAIATVLRGHLEICGITTVDDLAAATTFTTGRVSAGLAYLERDGFALQGHYRDGASATEWVSRRLLARMHSYSRRSRRGGVEPATAQDFMRFLLRWQHVAPDTQLSGEAGLLTVVEQLQGSMLPRSPGNPICSVPGCAATSPPGSTACATTVRWPGCASIPPGAVDAPAGAPSKATPISVVARADLPWLLMGARVGADPGEPVVGATAEVLEVLRERGACFASELGAATNRLPEDIERALWDGVARGLVMSDGFGAIRARRPAASAPPTSVASRVSPAGPGSRPPPPVAGPSCPPPRSVALTDLAGSDRDELAEAVAELLLHRWGVVFRDLVVHDSLRFPWRDLQWALRRLEDRGLVRGGRFVSGFSGEQYALPAAHEQLTQTRKAPRTGERITLNATDPLNLVGVIVPGARVPAVRTRRVTFVDGVADDAEAGADAELRRAERLSARDRGREHALGSAARVPRLRRAARGLLRARAGPTACRSFPRRPSWSSEFLAVAGLDARRGARRGADPRGRGHRRARRDQRGDGRLQGRVHAGGRRRGARPPATRRATATASPARCRAPRRR